MVDELNLLPPLPWYLSRAPQVSTDCRAERRVFLVSCRANYCQQHFDGREERMSWATPADDNPFAVSVCVLTPICFLSGFVLVFGAFFLCRSRCSFPRCLTLKGKQPRRASTGFTPALPEKPCLETYVVENKEALLCRRTNFC